MLTPEDMNRAIRWDLTGQPQRTNGSSGLAAVDESTCPICGRDSCEGHPDVHRPAETSRGPTLATVRAVDAIDAPQPVEIIEGIAWAGCLTVLVAESGAGKTFVLLDAAAAVSDAATWHGRTTRRGSVVYLSFEGDALQLRLRAVRDVTGHTLEHVYIVRGSDPLSPHLTRDGETRSIGELAVRRTLQALRADLAQAERPPLGLVIIDTVRASMAGSEDSSEHVSAYLRAVRRIMAIVPEAAAILAHHAGWQDGDTQRRRERGSSAWRGNCDATLYLEAGDYDAGRGEAPLTLRTLKVRDTEKPEPLHLIRRRVTLDVCDSRGRPVTSCVIGQDHLTSADREAQAQAVAREAQHDLDLRILRLMAEQPALCSSQDNIRVAVVARKDRVSQSVGRLISAGWILRAGQRKPYTVTSIGRAALLGPSRRVVPSSSRVGPEPHPSSSPGSPLWGTGNDCEDRDV